ncbi:MAG: Iron(III) dicitrate transport system, periplasmic iron-binding protein FecB, partial [uncultured Rubrobacteraceae bacterium]
MVGTQDLFFTSRVVGGSARILDEAAPANSTAVTLLTFGGVPVSDGDATVAMAAIRDVGHFVFHYVPQCILTTPVEPLPSIVRFLPGDTRIYQKESFIGTILEDA